MATVRPVDAVRAFRARACERAAERLSSELGTIDGLLVPLLEQGLVDLDGVTPEELEELLRWDSR